MANKFQVDADGLHQISTLFYEGSTLVDDTLRELQGQSEDLRSGWIGEGANAFFAELEDRVLPYLRSLSNGLLSCNEQVTTLMKTTVDAENVIRGRLVR